MLKMNNDLPLIRQQVRIYMFPDTRTLIGLLRFHAQVLQALGDSIGAQTKLDEAAKLQQ